MANEGEDRAVRMGQLIAKKISGQLSAVEAQAFDDWLQESASNRQLYADLLSEKDKAAYLQQINLIDDEAAFKEIREKHDATAIPKQHHWRRIVKIAAVLVIGLSFTLYIYLRSTPEPKIPVIATDIPPGGNRAVLTLADGKTIDLDSASAGLLATQSGITVTKTADGRIAYEIKNTPPGKGSIGFNTITTPNGGQYQITLPDESTVWLNAASSLRYPTAFTGNERKVTLTGEAYFEVTRNEQQPFIVESNGQFLEVLGTKFNINAYTNEAAVVTTLITGGIRLYNDADPSGQLLKPGEQAIMDASEFSIKQVAVQDYTSWKDGLIVLNNADLPAIIRQIERWYDVEFEPVSLPASGTLSGVLPRNVKLSEVLTGLHFHTGTKFKLTGRRVMVTK